MTDQVTHTNPFDFFDAIFVINLDQDLDKWIKFCDQAKIYGFEDRIVRVPGVYREKGSYGCALAHKKCLDLARKKNLDNVLVFEDDAKFLYEPGYVKEALTKAVAALSTKSWDLFYIGMSMRQDIYDRTKTKEKGDLFQANGEWFGRFAYCVNKTSFDVFDKTPLNVRDFCHHHRGDVMLRARKDLKKFVVWPSLASVRNTPSKTDVLLDSVDKFVETRYRKFGMVDSVNVLTDSNNYSQTILRNMTLKPGSKWQGPVYNVNGRNSEISVVMPAFNVADYIEEALDSVAAEEPGEILVGIDHCPATLTKILSIRHKYPNLRIYWSETNNGPFVMRNTMAYKSKGQYLVFFDTDDMMKPGMLTKIKTQLHQGNDLVRYKVTAFKHGTDPEKGQDSSWYACGSTGMTRTAFLKAGGFQNWRCAGDREMVNRCNHWNFKEKLIPEALYFYRNHGKNLTVAKGTNMKSGLREQYHEMMKTTVTTLCIKPVKAKMYEITGNYVISANIGTFSGRRSVLKKALDTVLPHVDILRIYLNDYKELPDGLGQHPKVHVITGPDRKSASRFTWADTSRPEYFFTIDDDILYSAEYFNKHIEFLKNHPGSVVSLHGHVLKKFSESPYDMSNKVLSQVNFKASSNHMAADVVGAGVMAFDLSLMQFPITDFPYSDVTDATVGVLCKNRGISLYVRKHSSEEARALTLPKGSVTLWGNRNGSRKDRAKAVMKMIKPDISKNKCPLSYKEYVKTGIFRNKGMAELLYDWNYKKLCKKPEKLELYDFGKRLGVRQAKFIHTGNINDPFPEFPQSFCLKPVNGAGARGVFLMHKGVNLRDGKPYSMEQLRQAYVKDSSRYVTYSLNYFVEELLLNEDDIPDDVSLFMVEDKVGCILQAKRLGQNKGKVFYDAEWNVIGRCGLEREKPDKEFQRTSIATAKKIMAELKLPCMRVDFYSVKERGAYLGELTGASGVYSPNLPTSFKDIPEGKLLDKYCGWLMDFVDRTKYPNVWKQL